jgi:hypothetical protein
MKTYGGVEVYIQAFLSTALDKFSGHLDAPDVASDPDSKWIRELSMFKSRPGRSGEESALFFPGIEPRLLIPLPRHYTGSHLRTLTP